MREHRSVYDELLRFMKCGTCDGEVLPQNQLKGMSERFSRLPTQVDRLRRKIQYEMAKVELKTALQSTEDILSLWNSKYKDQDSVGKLLDDFQVIC